MSVSAIQILTTHVELFSLTSDLSVFLIIFIVCSCHTLCIQHTLITVAFFFFPLTSPLYKSFPHILDFL